MAILESIVLFFSLLYYKTFGKIRYTSESNDTIAKPALSSASSGSDHAELQWGADIVALLRSTGAEELATLSISSLVKRERYCRDTRQWQKVRNCYHPHASKTRVCIGAFQGNIDGFMNVSQMITPPGLKLLHRIDVVDVTTNGSKAMAVALETTYNQFAHGDSHYEMISENRIVLRLEVVQGAGWRICHWETVYNRDRLVPLTPDSPMPDIGAVSGARPPYRHLAWLTSLRGVTMPSDLPGDDRPDIVAKVLESGREWLAEKEN